MGELGASRVAQDLFIEAFEPPWIPNDLLSSLLKEGSLLPFPVHMAEEGIKHADTEGAFGTLCRNCLY